MRKFFRKMWTDPASGDPSASRFCLWVLVANVVIISLAEVVFKRTFSAWAQLSMIIASVCGVYGVNTGLRVWRGRYINEKDK